MSLPPSDVETGVSNGDVDWLFRGKPKKLTKKLASERKPCGPLDRTNDRIFGPNSKPTKDTTVPPKAGLPIEEGNGNLLSYISALNDGSAKRKQEICEANSGPGTTPESSADKDKNQDTTATKTDFASAPMDLFSQKNRSRSSSAPTAPILDLTLGASVSRGLSLNLGNIEASKKSIALEKGASLDAVQASSPNNMPKKSKHLFSFLSSKFRSSPNLSTLPKTSPSSSSSSSTFRNFLGHSYDLLSQTHRPPCEMGAQMQNRSSRKGSFSSIRLSEDKDRFFFRRRSVVTEIPSSSEPVGKRLNINPNREQSRLSEIPEVLLKRVTFAVDKLDKDPQQQIPSRKPRRGNVLIPEDLNAPIPRLNEGISATDSSRLNNEPKYSEQDFQRAKEVQKRALIESELHATEAHLSAKKLALQVAQQKCSKVATSLTEEDDLALARERIEIDKPIHFHETHFGISEEEVSVSHLAHHGEELPLDTLYTRCCHLREILPIPATLKQLKNKTRPLPVLKMLNPRPTLIDVLSFSDFVSITLINTVIFDNVTLTSEMLKHILGSLVHNEGVEKISLRNVPIDPTGWVYLCEFMARNTNVKKLDISQQKIKLASKQTASRASMDWNLLIEALIARKGLEELVMGGCKLPDEVFQRLLDSALAIGTYRLGVAGTELNVRKCEIISAWISRPESVCVGIDVAFNDLSNGQLRPFVRTFLQKKVKLIFFSLNSTNLTDVEEVGELLHAMARIKTLRFLDLSSVPDLFPGIILKLSRTLPYYDSLRRIHFDLNDLTSQSIDAIADILPRVPCLVHVSLLGNRNLERGTVGLLYTAVKNSDIFTLDLDYDLVPPEISQRLALYLMKNLDKFIRPDINTIGVDSEQEDVMFDGSLLMETAERMLLESDKGPGEADLKVQKIVTNALIDRTRAVRKEIHKIIDKLFERRNHGALSFEGKETLLRFCLLDASLEKLLSLFEEKAKLFVGTPLSPTPTTSQENGDQIDEVPPNSKQLHESSVALIDAGPILMAKNSRPCFHLPTQGIEAFEPHLVVIDACSDGRNVPVDYHTGKPVLMKSASQTSVHAKEQELEEGEFHRWGVFVQHRHKDDRENDPNSLDDGKAEFPLLGVVPSGSELRDAIIDAKGIESVTQLISKITSNRISIENIYRSKTGSSTTLNEPNTSVAPIATDGCFEEPLERVFDDSGSVDSEHDLLPVVNEAYDILLNEAERVRSIK